MSDNKFQMCPPLMSDGRHGTNYTPNSVMNEYIKDVHGIKNNNIYRTFLQKNAGNIINEERRFMNKYFNCHVPIKCSCSNLCKH
jgi:hypothetical protein